jgi:acetyl-CoA carboxylase biotin carboxyl carrier protein
MDMKQIQELMKLVNKSNIGELTIEKNDFKITIKQKKDAAVQQMMSPMPQQQYLPQSQASAPQPQAAGGEAKKTSAELKEDKLVTIKSPMIGTFYRQAGPGKPIFVNVGDEITPGKVVCIIEAMKLFNEIESEIKGTIVKVLVDDASPVEFDQPLFLVEPA